MNTEKHENKIKLHLLFPVGLGVSLLLISSIFVLKNLQKKNLDKEMNIYTDHVQALFQSELDREAESLQSSLDFLLRDIALQKKWIQSDRRVLLEYSLPIYQNILSKQNITHFYFMDPNCVCFLRVHQPPRYGDHINRFTLKEASEKGETAWGIELGPLGTFTLRVVSPWRINGNIVGYLELGREVNPITENLKQMLNVELLFIVNKTCLDRSMWEEGMAMLGQKGQWDQFSQFVLCNSTLDEIPPDVFNYIAGMHECESEKHLESLFEVSCKGHRYKGKPIRLLDASGRDVGDILVLADVHSREAAIHRLSNILIVVYGILFLLLLTLFYFYFRRIGQNLNATYTSLTRETDEHKKTKEQVEQQNEFLKNIIESLPYPFYVIDAHTYCIKLANSAVYPGKLPSDATCYGVTHRQDKPCNNPNDICPLGEIIRTKKPVVVEHIHFNTDGTPRIMEVHGYPVLNRRGEIKDVIEYSIDITERKRAEKELENARIKAEDATRLKSEFLANMSHEIRTPMNAIIGFGQLLCEEELKPTQKEYVQVIVRSGQALLQLINDILDFSKIEAGKLLLDITKCNLQELLIDMDLLFKPQMEKKGLTYKVCPSADLPSTIDTDSSRLRQCLINLIGNAIKFTSKGSITLFVYLESSLEKPSIRFDIHDTGIGIPQEKLSSIFDPFTQADGSITRRYGGTGLGLTITHNIVSMLGGVLSVSSNPQKGSVFSIQLPINALAMAISEVKKL
jgi:signal transduction histidine kinase